MPWKEADLMSLKREFILKSFNREQTFIELFRAYGKSTKTGCKDFLKEVSLPLKNNLGSHEATGKKYRKLCC